jgi:hypothetical protein
MVLLTAALLEDDQEKDECSNICTKTRQSGSKRRCFDNAGCLIIIKRDHLSPDALFGKEFPYFFD